jgi:hypothetical protein
MDLRILWILKRRRKKRRRRIWWKQLRKRPRQRGVKKQRRLMAKEKGMEGTCVLAHRELVVRMVKKAKHTMGMV